MAGDGRFQKGFDPRRNMHGGPSGVKYRNTVERNLEAAKIDKEIEEKISNDKTMPLDYMLRRMRDPRMNEAERFAAAARAAPYCHAQLQAIAHRHLDASGKPVAPVVTVSIQRVPPEAPRLRGPKGGDDAKQIGKWKA
jgi:hypothetical protein